jgi:hypothetical protein
MATKVKKIRKAKQLTPRQVAARMNGSKGGKARAKNLSPEKIKAIAGSGGKAAHLKYGDDFFAHMASRRKRVGRYSTPVEA